VGDVLLRERVKVLARTLDAVALVINNLEGAAVAPEALTASTPALEAVANAQQQLNMLTEQKANATFPDFKTGIAVDQALVGLRGHLNEIQMLLQAPPATPRAAVRVKQAVSSLSEAVGDRSNELAGLRAEIEAPGRLPDAAARTAAWKRCLEIEAECSRLFADYLDLVSGVTLRDAGRDDGLCRIADALVSEFDPFGTASWDSLTVPASRELREDPVARFVRIGFPEWSVWTLPLAMVDFAAFLILEHRRTAELRTKAAQALKQLLRNGTVIPEEALASLVARLRLPADPTARAELEDEALRRLAGMLLLEALATAIMGPAYAWAALLMRVDVRSNHGLVERLRRDAVVATLGKLNPAEPIAAQLKLFETEWEDLLTSAGIGAPGDSDGTLAQVVELVAQGAVARVSNLLGEGDWKLIVDLADKLHQEVPAEQLVRQIGDLHGPPFLRHVLNAAWLARLTWPEDDAYREPTDERLDPSPLSRAVRDVCLIVIQQPKTRPGASGGGPGPNPSLGTGRP
jgi:hypothetical protein